MSLQQIREQFQKAADSSAAHRELKRLLEAQPTTASGILTAYRAAAKALDAAADWNPMTKLSTFMQANRLFDQAVKLDPANPEIRFLRFMINIHAPGLLRQHVDEDKRLFLEGLSRFRDFDLEKSEVLAFLDELRQGGHISESELERVSHQLSHPQE